MLCFVFGCRHWRNKLLIKSPKYTRHKLRKDAAVLTHVETLEYVLLFKWLLRMIEIVTVLNSTFAEALPIENCGKIAFLQLYPSTRLWHLIPWN